MVSYEYDLKICNDTNLLMKSENNHTDYIFNLSQTFNVCRYVRKEIHYLEYLLVYDNHYPSFSLAISANEKYKIFRMLSPNFTFSFGIAIFASPLIMVN